MRHCFPSSKPLLLQQLLPFTVLKPTADFMLAKPLALELQQLLPFTVLKPQGRNLYTPC